MSIFPFCLLFGYALSRASPVDYVLTLLDGQPCRVWAEAGVKQVRKGGRGVQKGEGCHLASVPMQSMLCGFELVKCRFYSSRLNLSFPSNGPFSPVKSP